MRRDVLCELADQGSLHRLHAQPDLHPDDETGNVATPVHHTASDSALPALCGCQKGVDLRCNKKQLSIHDAPAIKT